MSHVPRNQVARQQQCQQCQRRRQISQFSHSRHCNDCRLNANSQHLKLVQVHRHVIQVRFRLHRARNQALVVLHRPVKLI